MTLPIVLQDDPSVDLLHTLEIEASDDPGQVLVTVHYEDCAAFGDQHVFLPVEKIPSICSALMKLWKESQQ